MGRKQRETTEEERKIIINLRKEGKSIREIGKSVKKSYSAIKSIIDRHVLSNNFKSKKRSGRPQKLTLKEKRIIVNKIRRNPEKSAVKLTNEVVNEFKKDLAVYTVRNVLYEAGFHGRVARKKPFINKINKLNRKLFAKNHKDIGPDFWNKVVFSDESKFNIFGSDGCKMVWRQKNKEMEEQNLKPTVKHGGGSVLVWGW